MPTSPRPPPTRRLLTVIGLALAAAGCELNVDPFQDPPVSAPTEAPQGGFAVALSGTQVRVAWYGTPIGSLDFDFERATSEDGPYRIIGSSHLQFDGAGASFIPPFLDETADPETRFWYRARATNSGGQGPWSAPVSVSTLSPGTRWFPCAALASFVHGPEGTFGLGAGTGRVGCAGVVGERFCDESYVTFVGTRWAIGRKATVQAIGGVPTGAGDGAFEAAPLASPWSPETLSPASLPAPLPGPLARSVEESPPAGPTIVRWDVTELMKGWFTGAIPRHGLLLRDPRQGSPDPIDPRLLEFGFIDLIVE